MDICLRNSTEPALNEAESTEVECNKEKDTEVLRKKPLLTQKHK